MIVRNGLATSFPVLFEDGQPDGNVDWLLYDMSGTLLTSGTVVVQPDDVSINIQIEPGFNTLAGASLYTSQDLAWSYSVNGAIFNGEARYSIEARPPFGASYDGVRSKMGVAAQDLPDGDIFLIRAYLNFREVVGSDLLIGITDETTILAIGDAIEAQAGLSAIPTMAVRVAASEDSGTNAFKRQPIDWTAVAGALAVIVNNGILALISTYDPTSTAGALFLVGTPTTDPITNAAYDTTA